MPKTINEYFQPSSTGVHNNIDNLIIGAELDRFAQTGFMYTQTSFSLILRAFERDFTCPLEGFFDKKPALLIKSWLCAITLLLSLKYLSAIGRKQLISW